MFDQFSPGATFFFLAFEINFFHILSNIASNIKIEIEKNLSLHLQILLPRAADVPRTLLPACVFYEN